jgi:hypothetical protein
VIYWLSCWRNFERLFEVERGYDFNRFAPLHHSIAPFPPTARHRYSTRGTGAPLASYARVTPHMIVVLVGALRGSRMRRWFRYLLLGGEQLWFGRHPMVENGLLSEQHPKKTAVYPGGFVRPIRVPIRQFDAAVRPGADCGFLPPIVVFNSN